MSDKTRMIEAIYGPYKGQRLTVSQSVGDQAIKDGWARDPFAPSSDEPAKELSDKEREAMMAEAERAARKLRGEDESKAEQKPAEKAMSAGPGAGYQTRDVKTPEPQKASEPPAKKR